MSAAFAHLVGLLAVIAIHAVVVIPSRMLEGALCAIRARGIAADFARETSPQSGAGDLSDFIAYARIRNVATIRVAMAVGGLFAGWLSARACTAIFHWFGLAPGWLIVGIVIGYSLLPPSKSMAFEAYVGLKAFNPASALAFGLTAVSTLKLL